MPLYPLCFVDTHCTSAYRMNMASKRQEDGNSVTAEPGVLGNGICCYEGPPDLLKPHLVCVKMKFFR